MSGGGLNFPVHLDFSDNSAELLSQLQARLNALTRAPEGLRPAAAGQFAETARAAQQHVEGQRGIAPSVAEKLIKDLTKVVSDALTQGPAGFRRATTAADFSPAILREEHQEKLRTGQVAASGISDAKVAQQQARAIEDVKTSAAVAQGLVGNTEYIGAAVDRIKSLQALTYSERQALLTNQEYQQVTAGLNQVRKTERNAQAIRAGGGIPTAPAGFGIESAVRDLYGTGARGGPDTAAAAAALGVSQGTVRRWITGERQGAGASGGAAFGRLQEAAAPLYPEHLAAQAQAVTRGATVETSLAAEGLLSVETKAASAKLADARLGTANAIKEEQVALEGHSVLLVKQAELRGAETALLQQGLAISEAYNLSKVSETEARKLGKASQVLYASGIDPTALESPGAVIEKAAERTRINALRAHTATIEGRSAEEIEATVRDRISTQQQQLALKTLTEAELRRAILAGEAGGSGSQIFQSLRPKNAGKLPEELPGIGGALGGLTGQLGPLVGITAAFGLFEAVKGASELNLEFVKLQDQLTAMGHAGDFGTVRDGIKGIAVETGQAAKGVTEMYSRLLGISGDPTKALVDTEAAMKIVAITGSSVSDVMKTAVPIAHEFGVSIERVGDVAVSIRDKFGIAEQSTLSFLASVAPVAKEAGLSLEAIGFIGAGVASSLGKDMAATGDQFARILPTITQNQHKIFEVIRANPKTESLAQPLVEAIGAGETGKAFELLLRDYGQLDDAQKANLIRVAGSRREWTFLAAAFSNADDILGKIDKTTEGNDSAGRLNRRFEEVQKSMKETFERLKQQINDVVEALASSGILDAFQEIGTAILWVVGLVGTLVSVFNKLNDVTKKIPGFKDSGLLGDAVQAAIVVGALVKVFGLLAQATDAVAAAAKNSTIATQLGIAVKKEEIVVDGADVVAETSLAGAKGLGRLPGIGALFTSGGAAAASGGAAAAIVLAGVLAVNKARDNVDEDTKAIRVKAFAGIDNATQQQLNDLKKRVPDVASDSGVGSRFQEVITKQESVAQHIYKAESNLRGKPGADIVDSLAGQKKLGAFVSGISDANLVALNKQINQNTDAVREAEDLGADRQRPGHRPEATVTRQNLERVLENARNVQKDDTANPQAKESASYILSLSADVYNRQDSLKGLRLETDRKARSDQINAKVKEVGGWKNYLEGRGLNDPEGQLATGQITRGEYLTAAKKKVADLQSEIGGSDNVEKAQTAFDAEYKKIQDLQDKWNQERVGVLKRRIAFTSFTPKKDALEVQLKNLPQSPEARAALLPELHDQQYAIYQEELAGASSLEERRAIEARGVKIDPRIEAIENDQKKKVFDRISGRLGLNPDVVGGAIVKKATEKGLSLAEAAKEYLTETAAELDKTYGKAVGDAARGMIEGAVQDLTNLNLTSKEVQPLQVLAVNDINERFAKYQQDANLSRSQGGTASILKSQFDVQSKQAKLQSLLDIQATDPDGSLHINTVALKGQITDAQAVVNDSVTANSDVVASIADAMAKWPEILDAGNAVKVDSDVLQRLQGEVDRRRSQSGVADEQDPVVIGLLQQMQQTGVKQINDQIAAFGRQQDLLTAQHPHDSGYALQRQLDKANNAAANAAGPDAQVNAQIQLQLVKNQIADESIATFKRQQDLLTAQHPHNADYALQRQLATATNAVATAPAGSSAQQDALIQLQQVQNQIADLAEATTESSVALAIGLLNAQGHTVEAAQKAADEANRRLAAAQAGGADANSVNALALTAANANKAAVDASVAEDEDMINYLLTLKQITAGEAVSRLQVEAAKYEQGTKQWRDIQLKIYQLQQQAEQNYQYNLPANIALPTLYEARRLNQSNALGIGYQDNRAIQLNIQVNGDRGGLVTAGQIVSALQDATGRSPVVSAGVGGVIG